MISLLPHSKPTVTGPLNGPKALFSSAFGRISGPDSSLPTKSPKPTPIKQGSRFSYRPVAIPWAELSMPFAACVFLAIALGFVAYRSGLNRGTASTQQKAATSSASARSIEEQISDFGHERSQFLTKLADDDRAINDFKQQIAEQTDEIKRLKAANANVGASKQSGSQSAQMHPARLRAGTQNSSQRKRTSGSSKQESMHSASSARTRRSRLRRFK